MMIASVKARQSGSENFASIYAQLCALQDSCPLSSVKERLDEGILDLNADRIRNTDWPPILNALRINKSLHKVSFKSYFRKSDADEDRDDGKQKHCPRQKPPPIHSKDISHKMCLCIKECLQISENLVDLSIENIPLRRKDVQWLAKGIAKSRTLQKLSLEYCRIGDSGTEVLCQGVRNSLCLKTINISGCGLTRKGMEHFAKIIKFQSTNRHSEAWKDSLRYRRPDLDLMPGLRRITLNKNPLIGDEGAAVLAETLKDDLWLKALDMQHCGISNAGAQTFLEALHDNSTIMVLDIRLNHLIDHKLLKRIIEQVLINSRGREEEYPWMEISSPVSKKQKPQKRQRRTTGSRSIVSKTPASDRAIATSTQKHDGCDHIVLLRDHAAIRGMRQPGPGFVPWRTAARAKMRRLPPGVHPEESGLTSSRNETRHPNIHFHPESPSITSEMDTSTKDSSLDPASYTAKLEQSKMTREIKEIRVQLEELSRRLDIESQARSKANERVMELEMENSRLRQQLKMGMSQMPIVPQERGADNDGKIEMDEKTLSDIEETFAKFHGFLDLLRDAGLGQLCMLVGLNTQDMRHPAVSSILKNFQPVSDQASRPTVQISTPHHEEERVSQPFEVHRESERRTVDVPQMRMVPAVSKSNSVGFVLEGFSPPSNTSTPKPEAKVPVQINTPSEPQAILTTPEPGSSRPVVSSQPVPLETAPSSQYNHQIGDLNKEQTDAKPDESKELKRSYSEMTEEGLDMNLEEGMLDEDDSEDIAASASSMGVVSGPHDEEGDLTPDSSVKPKESNFEFTKESNSDGDF